MKKITRYILIILIIVNCISIFKFSAEKSEKSDETSGGVINFIIENNPKTKSLGKEEKDEIRKRIVKPVRKTAHFAIYTSLGAFIYLYTITFEDRNNKKMLTSLGFAFLYACTDEIHQLFVPGRSGQFKDVCIDSCGALFGILLVWIFMKIWLWINRFKSAYLEKLFKTTR